MAHLICLGKMEFQAQALEIDDTLRVQLTERQRVDAIRTSGTAGGDGQAANIDFLFGSYKDIAQNFGPTDKRNGSQITEVADTILPSCHCW